MRDLERRCGAVKRGVRPRQWMHGFLVLHWPPHSSGHFHRFRFRGLLRCPASTAALLRRFRPGGAGPANPQRPAGRRRRVGLLRRAQPVDRVLGEAAVRLPERAMAMPARASNPNDPAAYKPRPSSITRRGAFRHEPERQAHDRRGIRCLSRGERCVWAKGTPPRRPEASAPRGGKKKSRFVRVRALGLMGLDPPFPCAPSAMAWRG
jgi:hypothetical protein